jgi:hypothetical protein
MIPFRGRLDGRHSQSQPHSMGLPWMQPDDFSIRRSEAVVEENMDLPL